ncbi:hypothetical protein [Trinickia sp. Y13]|uniref:hypothetical protein n=1 Tax=Trinickia sp. Y13 TaxID=2917807 RepID=UPI0024053810|nr:hypothetical protein [Trinickia sp. Y13]MDG0025589.1 hypothetical protein [Trinickia sp. Y13]
MSNPDIWEIAAYLFLGAFFVILVIRSKSGYEIFAGDWSNHFAVSGGELLTGGQF